MRARAALAAVVAALTIATIAEAPSRVPQAHAQVARVATPPEPVRLVARGGVPEARRWARGRAGKVGFAVAGDGKVRGVAIHHAFYSASVVKAMLALAVTRLARDRRLTSAERAQLRPMVTYSDNDAATAVYARIGAAPLYAIARVAGMRRFSIGGNWADARLTAYDQARLFLRIDRMVPDRHRGYLRSLLGGIVPSQRWGIAPVAEKRGFHILFKGGWRIGIFHQVALLERDGKRIALAVLTSGTGHGYGRATQSGIAARVLAELRRRH